MKIPTTSQRATREQLLHMLAEASEFEHNLLLCYLYAAFSLKRTAGPGLSAEDLPAIERWRKSIMAVAMEEMVHLALVANPTVSIGRAHFNRPQSAGQLWVPSGEYGGRAGAFRDGDAGPLHFPRTPGGDERPDGEGFTPEADYDRGDRAGAALMPSADDYESIAEFYENIRTALTRLSKALGDERLFTGGAALQVGADVIPLEGLIVITDLASAVTALDTIVVQGEGSSGDSEDSHFAQFSQIKAEYEAKLEADPAFAPAHPAARKPVLREPVDPQDRTHIDDPHAAALLDVANALYNQMLRLLSGVWPHRSDARGEESAHGRGDGIDGSALDSRRVCRIDTGGARCPGRQCGREFRDAARHRASAGERGRMVADFRALRGACQRSLMRSP